MEASVKTSCGSCSWQPIPPLVCAVTSKYSPGKNQILGYCVMGEKSWGNLTPGVVPSHVAITYVEAFEAASSRDCE